MDFKKKNIFCLSNKGQSATEYILLLLVIVAITSAVFSNRRFKDFFAKDSGFMLTLKRKMEYSYQYANYGLKEADAGDDYEGNHKVYWNDEESKTHFFAPTEKYE